MDAVEQMHRFFRLVRLQLPDAMQRDIGIGVAQGGPFGSGFLYPVFAENALARLYQRNDRFGRMRFADRDQLHFAGFAAGDPGGVGDPGADVGEGGFSIHRAPL